MFRMQEGKHYYLENSFDKGVITGVMEFIQEECSLVEVGKIIIERDKKMALAKDEDEKWKIIEEYREKTKPILDINENN